MAKKRVEWRFVPRGEGQERAHLNLMEGQETRVSIPFRPRDLIGMQTAMERIAAHTTAFRAKGYAVNEKQVNLEAMMQS